MAGSVQKIPGPTMEGAGMGQKEAETYKREQKEPEA
jgi:hypothetical protein